MVMVVHQNISMKAHSETERPFREQFQETDPIPILPENSAPFVPAGGDVVAPTGISMRKALAMMVSFLSSQSALVKIRVRHRGLWFPRLIRYDGRRVESPKMSVFDSADKPPFFKNCGQRVKLTQKTSFTIELYAALWSARGLFGGVFNC